MALRAHWMVIDCRHSSSRRTQRDMRLHCSQRAQAVMVVLCERVSDLWNSMVGWVRLRTWG